MRIYAETYGCSLNRGESREMLEAAEERGHRIVASVEEADVLILDTCTVIQTTENRMLDRLRLMARAGKPVVVAGCMASARPARVRAICAGAILLPPDKRRELPSLLETLRWLVQAVNSSPVSEMPGGDPEKGQEGEAGGKAAGAVGVLSPVVRPEGGTLLRGPGPGEAVWAELPIASGCTSGCTYCITRIARGKLSSRSVESLVERAAVLLRRGYRELRLAAQDTATYGVDIHTSLPELVSGICSLDGNFRVRIGMMNPGSALRILPALIEVMRRPKVFRFLHVPVQSGDDGMLEAMGRGYTVEDFMKVVGKFREAFPLGLLATDVIVGFPGEGEREFTATLSLIEQTAPDIINIKAYSPRPGTAACRLPGRPPHLEVRRRISRLRELQRRISLKNNERLVGRVEEVLVSEMGANGGALGRTGGYYPVIIPGGPAPGSICNVKISAARPGYVLGEAVTG